MSDTRRRLYYFYDVDIGDALDEALAEKEREPQTDVWDSFWDRLTEGELDVLERPSRSCS